MRHVEPRKREDLAGLEPLWRQVEAGMGFVPNSMLTMAHMEQLPVGFFALTSTVFGGDLQKTLELINAVVPEQSGADENLPPQLVQLIAFAGSVGSGCRYCQAHTSHNVVRAGVAQGDDEAVGRDKLDNILRYDTHPAFSEAERAVVALAMAAAAVPNESGPEHFAALREHFSDRQIVQIVGVISMFGFLNRWNDTMATMLEEQPEAFAGEALSSVSWQVGKHAAGA